MIKEIKKLKVKIDELVQLTKELKPIKTFENTQQHFLDYMVFGKSIHKQIGFNSKEIEKAVDSLCFAKAWLGKLLGELGESTPYVNDGNRKTVDDIEPAADKAHYIVTKNIDTGAYDWDKGLNHIEKIDWLRQEIEKVVNQLWVIKEQLSNSTFNMFNEKEKAIKAAIASTNTYNYLCEARFWLGFELERIKNNG
jgi:hypothetical protein